MGVPGNWEFEPGDSKGMMLSEVIPLLLSLDQVPTSKSEGG
jgi:hypothetical protein